MPSLQPRLPLKGFNVLKDPETEHRCVSTPGPVTPSRDMAPGCQGRWDRSYAPCFGTTRGRWQRVVVGGAKKYMNTEQDPGCVPTLSTNSSMAHPRPTLPPAESEAVRRNPNLLTWLRTSANPPPPPAPDSLAREIVREVRRRDTDKQHLFNGREGGEQR